MNSSPVPQREDDLGHQVAKHRNLRLVAASAGVARSTGAGWGRSHGNNPRWDHCNQQKDIPESGWHPQIFTWKIPCANFPETWSSKCKRCLLKGRIRKAWLHHAPVCFIDLPEKKKKHHTEEPCPMHHSTSWWSRAHRHKPLAAFDGLRSWLREGKDGRIGAHRRTAKANFNLFVQRSLAGAP